MPLDLELYKFGTENCLRSFTFSSCARILLLFAHGSVRLLPRTMKWDPRSSLHLVTSWTYVQYCHRCLLPMIMILAVVNIGLAKTIRLHQRRSRTIVVYLIIVFNVPNTRCPFANVKELDWLREYAKPYSHSVRWTGQCEWQTAPQWHKNEREEEKRTKRIVTCSVIRVRAKRTHGLRSVIRRGGRAGRLLWLRDDRTERRQHRRL